VATQRGNQGRAFEGNRRINEWLADGCIGPVREVHVWSDRPTLAGRSPLYWAPGLERPTDTPLVSSVLDWDLWRGPAPWRPYHPAYVPFKWRGWWDFGSGGLGDMGIHNIAPVFSTLKLGAPSSVHASSTPVFPETLPAASIVHYEFPARGDLPTVKLQWYDGGIMPSRPEGLEDARELKLWDGMIFVGDQDKMSGCNLTVRDGVTRPFPGVKLVSQMLLDMVWDGTEQNCWKTHSCCRRRLVSSGIHLTVAQD
jgi:predicted dehydrogenase